MPEQGENRENIQQGMPQGVVQQPMPPRMMQGGGTSQVTFPRQFSMAAIAAYFVGLLAVTVMASSVDMVMEWYWWVFGIVEVVGFFLASTNLSQSWKSLKSRTFEKKLFWTGFGIRAITVLFLYWFFYEMHGNHLMFASADEEFYVDIATYGASRLRDGHWGTFITDMIDYTDGHIDVADMGYPVWSSIVFFFVGDSIFLSRIVKAALGAYTCVLIYRVAKRNFGESVGRMSAIFCMLMPNLIYYCGINLKEIEMIFVIIVFLNSADKLLHNKKPSLKIYILPILSALTLFTFRNVLGMTAVMALGLSLFISNVHNLNISRRWAMLIILVIIGSYFVGGKIYMEAARMWEDRETAQEMRLQERAHRSGNKLIENASAAVFAPFIFTLPFPTMIETEGQETLRMIHGGLVVKNIMSGLTIFAIFLLLLEGESIRKARWREHVLLVAMLGGYLVILVFSAFAHAERFHLPAVPMEMIFAAYGVSRMTKKQRFMFSIWCAIMVAAMIGWNWFKLRGRGLA